MIQSLRIRCAVHAKKYCLENLFWMSKTRIQRNTLYSMRCHVAIYDGESSPSGRPQLNYTHQAAIAYMCFSCSCALKYLDATGIFHEICQACDAHNISIVPDLSVVLDTIDTSVEPDLSWIPGFRPQKRKSTGNPSPRLPKQQKIDLPATKQPRTPSSQPSKHVDIVLPTIDEIPEFDNLALQTPSTKRKRRGAQSPEWIIEERPAPSPFQWTPKAQRIQDVIDLAEKEWVDPDDDPDMDDFRDEMREAPTPMQLRRRKFAEWRDRVSGGCKCCGPRGPNEETLEEYLEQEAKGETYEEFLELEGRNRKKPKYAF